jgi:hypothetical protein
VQARGAITGITLIAGFASTVGWPASTLFLDQFGWRWACLIWAGLNLFVAGPLNLLLIPRQAMPATARPRPAPEAAEIEPPRGAMLVLAFFFSATWFVQGAMAAHLPGLLAVTCASSTAAIAAATMVGPAQVGARLIEFGVLRSLQPVTSARIATVLHPIGAGFLMLFGGPAVAVFAVLHGGGNGLITIAKGTLPLSLFGPNDFARRSGLLSAPARVSRSAAPFLFGVLLDRVGADAVSCQPGFAWPRLHRCSRCGRAAARGS